MKSRKKINEMIDRFLAECEALHEEWLRLRDWEKKGSRHG